MSTGIYSKTAGDLIRDALRDASIVGAAMPIDEQDFKIGSSALNDVLSYWQAKSGINLWRETEAVLPLNPDQRDYNLGVNGDHCFTSYGYTTLSASALSSATTISLVSATQAISDGFGVGDFIGIELADGSRHWATISSLSSSSATFSPAIPSAADSGASIYIYTDKIDRPIRILDARNANDETGDETPVSKISRQEYYQIPNKRDSSSSVNQWYYSPQLTLGKLLIWPPADNCKRVMRFTFVKLQYIPEDQTENILIPSEWFLPLKWAVASELAVTYAISADRLIAIETKAKTMLEEALSNDVENDYFSVQPE